jgi:hypothetical protein
MKNPTLAPDQGLPFFPCLDMMYDIRLSGRRWTGGVAAAAQLGPGMSNAHPKPKGRGRDEQHAEHPHATHREEG